jgi:hypothetical protein
LRKHDKHRCRGRDELQAVIIAGLRRPELRADQKIM